MKPNPRPAALAALLMIGASAFAQQPPPPPPLGPPPPMEAADSAAPIVTGRVQQWLLNPNGEVDGLLLADGTQVAFPPHLSADALRTFKPGDTVQVSGWRATNVPVVRAASLTASATGKRVVDQPPALGAQPPRPPDASALSAMSANGRVSRVLYTDRGDANGVLLDSGTIVRFPPHVGARMTPALKVGDTLFARGWGSRSALGTALEATGLGNSADTLRDLFAGPGPDAGPRRATGPGPRLRGEPLPPAPRPAS